MQQNNLVPGLFLSQDFLNNKNMDTITVYSRTGNSVSSRTFKAGINNNNKVNRNLSSMQMLLLVFRTVKKVIGRMTMSFFIADMVMNVFVLKDMLMRGPVMRMRNRVGMHMPVVNNKRIHNNKDCSYHHNEKSNSICP